MAKPHLGGGGAMKEKISKQEEGKVSCHIVIRYWK